MVGQACQGNAFYVIECTASLFVQSVRRSTQSDVLCSSLAARLTCFDVGSDPGSDLQDEPIPIKSKHC